MLVINGKSLQHPKYVNIHICGEQHKKAFAAHMMQQLQSDQSALPKSPRAPVAPIADSTKSIDAAAPEDSQAVPAFPAPSDSSSRDSHVAMNPNTAAPFPPLQSPAIDPCALRVSVPPQPLLDEHLEPSPCANVQSIPSSGSTGTSEPCVEGHGCHAIVPYHRDKLMPTVALVQSQAKRQMCKGLFLEDLPDTVVSNVIEYIKVWMANGQISYKQSAALRLIFTWINCKVHVRCTICFNSGVMLISSDGPCCVQCLRALSDDKIASDLVSLCYLVQKCKVLGAEAKCECFL